jgi:hypothetical protein
MHIESHHMIDEILNRLGSLRDDRVGEKVRFAALFEAELLRLDTMRRELTQIEEENLLSALGAAGIGEYELASAFVEAATQAPVRVCPTRRTAHMRPSLSIAHLRKRFERWRAAND